MSTGLRVGEGDLPARLFSALEQSAAQAAERAAGDPRTLEFGAALIRSQLMVARALGLMWEASLQPLLALIKVGRGY